MSTVKKFIHSRLSQAILIVLTFVCFSVLPMQPTTFASSAATAETIRTQSSITAEVDSLVQNLASLLATLVKVLNYLLWPILFMIGGLMDNSLIFGPGVEDRLYLIWSQIRNLINLLFAVALIGVALYNVLGLSKDGNYALKTFLPSMVVTLVLVNFSFFGVRLALDVANVATTAVFALPNTVEQSFSTERIQDIESAICNNSSLENIQGNVTLNDQNINVGQITSALSNNKLCNGNTFSQNGLAQFRSLDKNNVGLVMAISFNRIATILEPSELTISNPSFINLAINLAIVLILQIVYLSAFFALFAVLVARIIALWIVTIASPLLVLKLGMSKAQLPGMGFLDSFNLQEMFINHATAPIKIGLGMSVGYMLLDVFQTVGSPSVYFPLGDDFTNVFSGVGSINELFISIVAIGIVWTVSFKAADTTFAKSITNRYQAWAEGLGRSIRDLAIQRTPILPLANGKGEAKRLSLGDIGKNTEGVLNSVGGKLDKIRGVSSEASDIVLKHTNDPGLILSSAVAESNINSMNKKQLELAAKGLAASDSPAFRTQYSRVEKATITKLLKKMQTENTITGPQRSTLDTLVSELDNPSSNIDKATALSRTRDIMKLQYRNAAGKYDDTDYKAAVKQYKDDLK